MTTFRLGRQKSPHDGRDYLAARLLKSAQAPAPPVSVDYITGVKAWGELGNDVVGNCTVAGIGHFDQAVTFKAQGREASITTSECIKAYSAITGYVPGDSSTDNGAVERDVLRWLLNNGLAGHKIDAFAAAALLDQSSATKLQAFKQAHYAFGGTYLGLDLPKSAEQQIESGQPWTPTSGQAAKPGSWGGHAVYCGQYDELGVTLITWGRKQRATWPWLREYCEEAWAILSLDWLKSNRSPVGLNLTQLEAELTALKSA